VSQRRYNVIVIGGGHAGVEAAWAAANLLGGNGLHPVRVALVTLDPSKVGVMSCNPANGGLAKGQLVREIDAMGGVMGLATDAAGIQFKMLNTSKGPAVWGPRAQCDKHAYAEAVQAMLAARPEIEVIAGAVDDLVVEGGEARRITGVVVSPSPSRGGWHPTNPMPCITLAQTTLLSTHAVVLTTGTFMRGLMHTGESQTPGGRHGEAPAVGIAGALARLGFELGRLKTGTPPRLRRGSLDWDALPPQHGDASPTPFSDLTAASDPCHRRARPCELVGANVHGREATPRANRSAPTPTPGHSRAHAPARSPSRHDPFPSLAAFPVLPQVACRITSTTAAMHDLIRQNLHRAPMFSGQIEGVGPRYCPSIEDKVVRFADRDAHTVFLEPESLRDDWIYCNGISTSLPADVQERLVRAMPGCERAEILRLGYAVEYDMVRPHQIQATGMTKSIAGLFLAGQINGTSGYEEAAAQGLVAGINAALLACRLAEAARGRAGSNRSPSAAGDGSMIREIMDSCAWMPDRAESYLGVLMDDLVTKTPVEPYRMFTSRAEHRLLLRADNAADRLTPVAERLSLLGDAAPLGRARRERFDRRRADMRAANAAIDAARIGDQPLRDYMARPEFGVTDLAPVIEPMLAQSGKHPTADAPCDATPGAPLDAPPDAACDRRVLLTILADRQYAGFIDRQRAEIKRQADMERRRIPATLDPATIPGLRAEARAALDRFRPETFGQAGRLEGITPADMTILAVWAKRTEPRA